MVFEVPLMWSAGMMAGKRLTRLSVRAWAGEAR